MALSAFATRARVAPLNKAGVRTTKAVTRFVVRAEPTEGAKAPATVYYGGKEYTEAEVR